MFTIGAFSKLAQVSPRMLRHYDKLGLFEPESVDPETGYRYYAAHQLIHLNRLIALKDLGFSLEEISVLQNDRLPLAKLLEMMDSRYRALKATLLVTEKQLAQLEARLRYIEERHEQPKFEVLVQSVPTMLIAWGRINHIQDIPPALNRIEASVAPIRGDGAPFALWHDGNTIDVAVPVAKYYSGTIETRLLTRTPQMAYVVCTGNHHHVREAIQSLHAWTNFNDYVTDGPIRQKFLCLGESAKGLHHIPQQYRQSQETVIELQVPLKPLGDKPVFVPGSHLPIGQVLL